MQSRAWLKVTRRQQKVTRRQQKARSVQRKERVSFTNQLKSYLPKFDTSPEDDADLSRRMLKALIHSVNEGKRTISEQPFNFSLVTPTNCV